MKADSWLDFELGGKPRPGIENMTADMAAKEIGVSPGRMRQLLATGRIQGAKKLGRDWIIPTPVQLIPGERGSVGVAGARPSKSGSSRKIATKPFP